MLSKTPEAVRSLSLKVSLQWGRSGFGERVLKMKTEPIAFHL